MKPFYLLINLANYIGLVPCLMVIYNRRYLNSAQLLFGAYILIGTLFGILSVILAQWRVDNLFIFPILAVTDSVLMGLFFAEIAKHNWLKWAIRVAFGANVGFVLFTELSQFVLPNKLELFTFMDFSVSGLSLFFLARLIRKSQLMTRKPLFWLLLALFLGALYDIAATQLGTLLAEYGGNRWKDLLWLQITPVVTVSRLCIITYGFYLARFQMVQSEKLPQFMV